MSTSKLFVLCLLAASLSSSLSAQDPAGDVLERCSDEIDSFCSLVTPGEGRLLACFYAHEDRLSAQCLHALYDASVALQQAANALAYIAASCNQDIDTHCGDLEPGDGRILNCLTSKRDELGPTCSKALQDVEE